jgi:hypothetical protein
MKTLAGLAALAVLSASSAAGAYCRTTNCDPNSSDSGTRCELDPTGCDTVGLPLAWERGCVSFSVHSAGSKSRGISYDTTLEVALRSFAAWQNADCGSGETPSIALEDLSPSHCGDANYNTGAGNANVVLFQDEEWPYANANSTLALTTITFNVETAEIFDADIEINSARTPLTVGNTAVNFDLESILTHEVGHFLGLAHSVLDGATMEARYVAADTSLRDLDADDIEGICEVYPPDRDTSSDSCIPRHGFTRGCTPSKDDGCSIARAKGSRSSGSWALWLAPLLLGLRLRRSRR